MAIVTFVKLGRIGHYILLWYQEGRIHVKDSLHPREGPVSKLGKSIQRVVQRFKVLLERRGLTVRANPRSERCAEQGPNNCAIEAVNNMVEVTTGRKGILSREHIREAHKHYLGTDDPFKFEVIGNQEQVKLEGGPTCCNREELADSFCAWHHPRIVALKDREKCGAQTSNKTRCNERAITLGNVGRCWHHKSPQDGKYLRALLNGDAIDLCEGEEKAPGNGEIIDQPKTRGGQPSLSGGGKPLSHGAIKVWLSSVPKNRMIMVRFRRPSSKYVTQCGAEVVRRGGRNEPMEIAISHRWCIRCEEWHSLEVRIETMIPMTEIAYYHLEIRDTNLREEECEDCGDDEDEEDHQIEVEQRMSGEPDVTDEAREALGVTISQPNGTFKIKELRKVFIHNERPHGVHKLVWMGKAKGTRDNHRRWLKTMKNLPPEFDEMPVEKAVVEMIMRKGKGEEMGLVHNSYIAIDCGNSTILI